MDWRNRFVGLPRWVKHSMLIGQDFILLFLAVWLAYCMRLGRFYVPDHELLLLWFAAPVIGVITFYYMGLYRMVTRFFGHQGLMRIYISVALAVLLWALLVLMSGVGGILEENLGGVPRSVVLIYGLLATFFIWLSRQAAGLILRGAPNVTFARFDPRQPVLIYGAGQTGLQLAQSLSRSQDYHVAGFVDDQESLWGQLINGIKVYQPSKIEKLVERNGIAEIFLAMPHAPRRIRQGVIRLLEPFPVLVKTLPSMEDLATGRVKTTDLRPVDVDDLLGRDPVPPIDALLAGDVRGKSVLVTGAGGSIGSELTRQVLQLGARTLVLLEQSEPALYAIEEELRGLLERQSPDEKHAPSVHAVQIVPVLGSMLDTNRMARILRDHGVQTIYHAAAYKHVPIVEANPLAGLRNNTFGTYGLAREAERAGVERFVFVSTDKAVRPTSVMGASKRLSEMALQSLASRSETRTVFTMVRFGNVLDSSGSVVQLFRKQIASGGPVTVTHPDIIRYFMSIPEAAQLVIQAGAMAKGGDVFVLDMGPPVKIADLARSMVHLMGLEVQDETRPDGDIAIQYVGLRQGEKLFEELLIGKNASGTHHPRIMRTSEPFPDAEELEAALSDLEGAIVTGDHDRMRQILMRTVEDYTPAPPRAPTEQILGDKGWTGLSRTVH